MKVERAKTGSDCALCDAHAKGAVGHEAHAPPPRGRAIPWIGLVILTFAVPPFLGESDRLVAFSLCAAVAACAGLAWLTHRMGLRTSALALAETTEELTGEADQRVAMVIRQFEWAVSDVTKLRDALKRTQDAQTAAEANERRLQHRLRLLEGQLRSAHSKTDELPKTNGAPVVAADEPPTAPPSEQLVVPLTWRIFEENKLAWLRLESAGIVPSQVRILNEGGRILTTGAPGAEANMNGAQVALALRAPDNVVATLEGRSADRFKFEALVGDVWCAVELKAATRSATPGAPNGNGHAAANGATNGATNGNGHGATNGATNGSTTGAVKESNGSSHWHPADDQHRQALIA